MHNYISYLAHSDIGYINECRFSILKYLSIYNLQPPADTAFVVYTDEPELFENFIPFFKQFDLVEINKDQLKKWYGTINYIHRAKPEMIKDFFTRYHGNLLFFDTDTYITDPIEDIWEAISENIVYMHNSEGVIDKNINSEFRKWDDFLRSNSITYGDKKFIYSANFQIWNSGVLGISQSNSFIINDVISLIDAIHHKFPKHITEQVACSYCFKQQNKIKTTDDRVIHYWNLKEFRTLLNLFFQKNEEESIPNLIKLANHIDAKQILSDKERFESLPLYKRYLNTLLGKGWNIKNYLKKI